MTGEPPRPTDAELEILTVLWSLGPATVREVHDVINQRRPAQYSTVLKFMQIMAEKKLVRRNESERAHVYEAARPREWTQQQLAGHLLERAFSGSAKALLIGALSAQKATKKELAEMRKLLDDYRGVDKMKFLEACVASPLAGAIGWTLLHSLWEGALIAAALAAVLMAVRSPRARHAAACLALFAILGEFGVTLVCVMPEVAQHQQTVRAPAFLLWNLGAGTATHGPSTSSLTAVVPWLAPCWFAGVWIFYLGQLGGWISVRRLRLRGVCAVPDAWRQELARLSAKLHISRPVMLLESCLANVPLVIGHFRPVILMPVGLLAGLPAAQIEAILLHELAHIRRCDYLMNLVQRAIEGFFFYHPVVWWISRVIRTERENCCDDVAVEINGNAYEYAVALTALEENRWPGREPAMAATGGNLVKRIRRLLYPEGPAGAWAPLFAGVLFVTTATLALAAWQSESPGHNDVTATAALAARQPQSSPQSSARTQRQTDPASTTPYVQWLNEDVVYIITAEERAAFQKLTTGEEREKFVEQFWLRRDPTPGTPENEFKAEHYRRIMYANTRFAGSKAGWKTDRGRIYIQSGPPDEIDSHPSGGADGQPFETWLYRGLGGVGQDVTFKFIDVKRTGDYELRKLGQGKGVDLTH